MINKYASVIKGCSDYGALFGWKYLTKNGHAMRTPPAMRQVSGNTGTRAWSTNIHQALLIAVDIIGTYLSGRQASVLPFDNKQEE